MYIVAHEAKGAVEAVHDPKESFSSDTFVLQISGIKFVVSLE